MSFYRPNQDTSHKGTKADLEQQESKLFMRREGTKSQEKNKKLHAAIDKWGHKELDAYHRKKNPPKAMYKALTGKKKK
jgi:hypothetical protein